MAYTPTARKKSSTSGISHEDIVRDVRAGKLMPVYYLMGEESYYIDHIADFIVASVLTPEERELALITVFGADTDIDRIMIAAQQFPMGASRLVIVVKEAQALKHIERLDAYLQRIQPTTILIFCHKNGSLDKRTKIASSIAKVGVVFESKKLYDKDLPKFVNSYLKRKGIASEPGVAETVSEFVGSDLNRLASELDKLIIALPAGQKIITLPMVRQVIAASKNFTIFELQDALGEKNVEKVNKIAKYFDDNPKDNPIQQVLPSLFKYFTNVMLAFYAPVKTESGIAQELGLSDWQVRKNVIPPMRAYSARKVMGILSEIRRTAARCNGIGKGDISNGDLMKELYFFILH